MRPEGKVKHLSADAEWITCGTGVSPVRPQAGRLWHRTRARRPCHTGSELLRSYLMLPLAVVASAGAIALGAEAPASSPASAPATRPEAPSRAEIRQAVRQLNHPIVAKRRAAIRQLARWGPLTFEELRRAAGGRNLEAAILARDLLAELERTILCGAEVRLEVNRSRVGWDEPFMLTVRAHNPTPGPIRVPWRAHQSLAATQPAPDKATQVAAMMDAADFLAVTGPDGGELDLRVEPIGRNPAVHEAVNIRAGDAPPSHLVEPGRTARLAIPLFNRGWARYPMLVAGTYTISFAYQPEWTDESWTKEGFGFVQAGPVTVEVRQEAPERVRQPGRPLSLHLDRVDDMLVVQVRSHWDLAQWINLNVGDNLEVQARLEWRFTPPGDAEEGALWLGAEAMAPVVRRDRIRRIDPGGSLPIARVPLGQLRARARETGWVEPPAYELHASYTHFVRLDRLRKALQANEPGTDLPDHVFTGMLASDPIRVGTSGNP